ncbi:metallophosphoesterase [Streptomyces sp. NPDC001553]|uniref:metallophosphoesterase n=1 Tax=Streptomyces sp. NPDC001553 TaxID=3154385 RepID=UPI0033323C2B
MKVRELREHAKELGFTPQEQVRWLAPKELARTAIKVVLAGVFAGYSDKRELQEVFPADLLKAPLAEHDARGIWIDYVADLGDGFDATSSVACTLAKEELAVEGPGSALLRLSRGSLLVLGGDEVYPAASATEYEDRMTGPYRSALPLADDQPLMVALPGNHDWYDGLTAFLRMFTQQRPIGAWQTRQTRSYFCVQLPKGWWLVGLDSQLGSYFDDPQLRYFEKHLSVNLKGGDGVIVCSAKPTWVESGGHDANAFNALHWFDRNYIRSRVGPNGKRTSTNASVRLWLTGDMHHYARYAERLPSDPPDAEDLPPDPRRRQMVTCGLGGAFLAATHGLPAALPLPPRESRLRDKDDPPLEFARAQKTYPDIDTSRRLARGIVSPWSRYWLPRRNTGFVKLAAALHVGLYLLTSFLFALAVGMLRPVDAVRKHGAHDDFWGFAGVCLIVASALIALGFLGRLVLRRRAAPPSGPAVAALSQAAVALAALAVTVTIPFPRSWDGWVVLLLCLAIAAVLGAVVGSGVFALWVFFTRGGEVAKWQMSGQSIEDHKGFLRLHVAPDGNLMLYPLVLERICRDWDLADGPDGRTRPVPAEMLAVRLIEDPVVISRGAWTP